MKGVEDIMGMGFGSKDNPLLMSVRSGARVSMPGMMDTVLNLGMNDEAVEAIAKKSGNERFAWDSYRRFVQMYGDVVLGMKPESKEDIDPFEEIMEEIKEAKGVENDNDLDVADLKDMVVKFKAAVKKVTGHDFPVDPWEQLWGAVCAVFDSWTNPRANYYRAMNQIPEEWGTAVNVQAMVFGNMGSNSGTGVAFTRDAATGENVFNGEYLIDAQGEDVVAGVRTPQQITKAGSLMWAELAGVLKKKELQSILLLKKLCQLLTLSLTRLRKTLSNTLKICKTLSLLFRMVSSGCFKPVMVSVPLLRW
jgi:pyruvate,orthophosphate dikinase